MTTDIPTEAVEAALEVRRGYEDPGCDDAIEGYLEAAAPHIAAQVTADLRTGIEALRDEWRAQSERLDGAPPAFGGPDEYARGSSAAYDRCADALDALDVGGEQS